MTKKKSKQKKPQRVDAPKKTSEDDFANLAQNLGDDKKKGNASGQKGSTTSSQANNTVNIFKMEPLGDSLKQIRFATNQEFVANSSSFFEFNSKCALAYKSEFGNASRVGGVPISTFDSELLEIACEETALAKEANNPSSKEGDYVFPVEPVEISTVLPTWSCFKINTKNNIIIGQLAATICKLFRLPIGSIRIIQTRSYNWKQEIKEPTEFENGGKEWIYGAYSNTKKGIEEYKEWKRKFEANSKSFGYFNTKNAEDVIKSNIDWREKSKRVFKLELDTSKPLNEAENLNWLKYFHDRMITHKLHNDCCKEEQFDGSVEVIWRSLLSMIRVLNNPALPKEKLHDFTAQNAVISIRPNYRDHSFLAGFKSYTRFYSLHSYGCVDFKYAFFHTTKYYSHVFYTKLLYRIVDLADKDSRDDEGSGWKIVWDNKLVDDPRFQEEDWIILENRQVNITLQEILRIRETLIGQKLNAIPVSKFIIAITNGATGAYQGETTLCSDNAWINYRIRKICNEPSVEDADFKEHDFGKDIKEALEEMKKNKNKKSKPSSHQSDRMYPTDEESGNMYRTLKSGRGGGGGGGCPQM